MAVVKGMEGSMTYAAVAMGNCRVIDAQVARAAIPSTVKGAKHATAVGGLVTRSITFSGLLDYATGQQDVIDFLETATPDVTLGTLVFTLATGKTWTWTSGALLTGYTISSPEGDSLVSFTCSFHLDVPAVVAWA